MNVAGKERSPFLFGFDFELTEGFFIENPESQTDILFHINNKGNAPDNVSRLSQFSFEAHPVGFDVYNKKFEFVKSKLESRYIDLLNLTIKTPLSCSLSLKQIFEHSNAKYRIYVPGRFVCFSPETFVKSHNGKICSYPMKGTIDASLPDAESVILNSKKELEEHKATVELIKSDLSIVANDVDVKRFRYVDEIVNHKGKLLQVSSEVEGVLPDDFTDNIGSYIFSLLPAGSIIGIPRSNALKVIKNSEAELRGYYTGVVGYFDGKDIDCGVLIRYIEEDGDSLYFRSGGGVTINSNAESEYNEILDKIYLPIK